MKRFFLPLVAVAALAVPAAAVAKVIEVNGPVTVVGRFVARGELQGSSSADPVQIRARRGLLRVLDLGGDAKVDCKDGRSATRENDKGQTVYLCAGKIGAEIQGGHFRFQLLSPRFGIKVPDGYTGKLGGRIHERGDGSAGDSSDSQESSPTP